MTDCSVDVQRSKIAGVGIDDPVHDARRHFESISTLVSYRGTVVQVVDGREATVVFAPELTSEHLLAFHHDPIELPLTQETIEIVLVARRRIAETGVGSGVPYPKVAGVARSSHVVAEVATAVPPSDVEVESYAV